MAKINYPGQIPGNVEISGLGKRGLKNGTNEDA